jgi:hypothetical protein
MKNLVLGIVIGIFLASAIFFPLYHYQIENYRNIGIRDGKIEAFAFAANKIEEHFGTYDGQSDYEVLFSVKTTDVIVIEKPDSKTIKVIL